MKEWRQTLAIMVTIIVMIAYFRSGVVDRIDRQNEKIYRQGERIDRLYELGFEMIKRKN